jgi:hypothetical protein
MNTNNASGGEQTSGQGLLVAQLRELYGRAAYTHKTHEQQADLYFESYRRQRRVKVGLTALSSGAFLASLTGFLLDEQRGALLISFIAVLLAASSLWGTTFKYGEEMQQHRDTAAKLWGVRESYLSLIVDVTAASITVEEGRLIRDRIQDRMEKVVSEAPRTTSKAYGRARDQLKNRQGLTFAESEIDQMLPERLRTGQEGNSVSSS